MIRGNFSLKVTRNSNIPKRSYRRWPGLKEASKQLNVSYGHARLVRAGARVSHSLLERLQALESQPKPDRQTAAPSAINEQNPRFPTTAPSAHPHPAPVDPADENYLDAWVQTVGKIGLPSLGFNCGPVRRFLNTPNLLKALGKKCAVPDLATWTVANGNRKYGISFTRTRSSLRKHWNL